MTADLVQFLRARLDEDERAALDATQHRWIVSERRTPATPESQYGDPFFVAADEGFGAPAFQFKDSRDAAHIARHDPARVLAEVDAKRRLLTVHKRDTTYSFSGCITCDAGDNSCGCMGGSAYAYPCETLRVLALPYASHPDYQTEWAPDPA